MQSRDCAAEGRFRTCVLLRLKESISDMASTNTRPEAEKATLGDLRARMRALELRVENSPWLVTAEEYRQLHLWRRVRRQDRAAMARGKGEFSEPYAPKPGGMHGGAKLGERVIPPPYRGR